MAESAVSSGSDAEKGIYQSDQGKARYDGEKGAPIYAEEPISEEAALEFGETKELRCVLLSKMQSSIDAYSISGRASIRDTFK
jgi:hypothetical protein